MCFDWVEKRQSKSSYMFTFPKSIFFIGLLILHQWFKNLFLTRWERFSSVRLFKIRSVRYFKSQNTSVTQRASYAHLACHHQIRICIIHCRKLRSHPVRHLSHKSIDNPNPSRCNYNAHDGDIDHQTKYTFHPKLKRNRFQTTQCSQSNPHTSLLNYNN